MANQQTNRAPRKKKLVAVLAMLAVVVAGGVGVAIAENARVLGKTKDTPKPLCPQDCLVTGTVSLFMRTADGEKAPYKFPSDGKIVGWSLTMSKPTKDQIDIFDGDTRFGAPAAARVGVVKGLGKDRFKLLRQSPKLLLEPYFGGNPIFTLAKPLNVKKGHVAILTLPSWAPAFAAGLAKRGNVSVVSRNADECGENQVLDARPHQKIKSVRHYGCKIAGERVIYRVYWVPDPVKK